MRNKRLEHGHALKQGAMLQNRYRICFCIGQGGFGITYEAYDTKLNISICIKEFFNSDLVCRNSDANTLTISENHRDEFFVRKTRFIAEAQNMALFAGHRNIPKVYEVFSENNTAYIVMELLDGEELSTYLKEINEPLQIDLALMIANEVCEALKAMHQKKIIHCDVAPDNIFICSCDEIRIKLIDFGAAHFEKEEDSIDAIVKPGYSAQEQYHSKNDVDVRCDIYSLGATLYMMLTQMKPQESTERKDDDRLLQPKTLNPLIGDNLNNVIMKAMAVEKHMRFNNIEEFQKALKDEIIVPPLKVEHKKRNIRRNILLCTIALITCFSIVFATLNGLAEYYREHLKPACITVRVDEGYGEAMEYLAQQFQKEYNQIEIEVIETTGYIFSRAYTTLSDATVCLSDYTTIAVNRATCENCLNLKEVHNSDEYRNMLQIANADANTVNVGFACPIILVINPMQKQNDDVFSMEGAVYYIDERLKNVSLSQNYEPFYAEDVSALTLSELLAEESQQTCIFLTESTSLIEIDALLQGIPYKVITFGKEDAFASLQAICTEGNSAQNNTMEMFLRYLCLDDCQKILMIYKHNDGNIPLAKEAMKVYCKNRKYYQNLLNDE